MASFRTAYEQREVPLELDVVGVADLKVGDCVKVTPETSTVQGYMAKETFANATHIIAQSDMTMEYGHVPVEYQDYKYSPVVKCTVTAAPTTKTTTWKRVALYEIKDRNDIILNPNGSDVKQA